MAAVVLAFALSLFGVYSFGLPTDGLARLDAAGGREGFAGAFLSGLLATALATPCLGPLLGAALSFAFAQPAETIMLIFLTIGLGMAAPFVALAARPGWMRIIPRPGAWMETFEQIMGFLLLATVVWLLSIVGAQTGTTGLVWTMVFLLCVALACWLAGKGGDLRGGATRRWSCRAAAVLVVVGGYLYFPEAYLDSFAGGAKAAGASAREAAATTTAPHARSVGAHEGEIAWEPFSVARVEQLAREGRTMFIDFSADWCLTCKINEKTFIEIPSVREALARYRVVPLKADWTHRDATIGRVLAEFDASGVPLYVIFPAGRPQHPIVLPTILRPGLIQAELAKAAAPPLSGATASMGSSR
ncbi:MAG: thioredoxin family protein [bacterium]|nr:thioredoxin family protein [bacterium]